MAQAKLRKITTSEGAARILPKGRYWITINHDDQQGTWLGWLDALKDDIHVENTSSREAEGYAPAWDFYIFTTDKDLIWLRDDAPSIAGPDIKSVQDTVQRPDPEPDITDQISDAAKKAGKGVADALNTFVVVGAAAVGLAVFVLLVRSKK